MRTLEAALREHLTCPPGHAITLTYTPPWVELVHHETPATLRARETVVPVVPQDQDPRTPEQLDLAARAQAGSAVFHTFSNAIAAEDGHRIVPLEITDEEYAGFLVGVPSA